MWVVEWQNPDAKGGKEFIKSNIFQTDCENFLFEHDTLLPNGKVVLSRCILECRDDFAILDYENSVVKTHNDKIGIFRGTMWLKFRDGARTELDQILWSQPDAEAEDLNPKFEYILDDAEADEGQARLRAHWARERSPKLRAEKIAGSDGKCDICQERYFIELCIGSIMEVHHKTPIRHGDRKSSLDDLAVLCPNCHRAIHAAMRQKGDVISVEEFRDQVRQVMKLSASPHHS